MTEEVRGSVTDRPWGMTLGTIAVRRHTGQLTIESDGKRFAIAFVDGAIVAATSPLAADALARIAVTNQFITSTQVADITRRIALAPDRDEVEVLCEVIGCSAEQALRLRHRLVAQRAARTFQLERGDFVLTAQVGLPVFAGVTIDHRHVIFLGARSFLSDQRLGDDLRQYVGPFALRPEAADELPRFGFEDAAGAVLEALRRGTSLPELEANRELEPRLAHSVIYALMSCNACTLVPRTTTPQPRGARTTTPVRLEPGARPTRTRELTGDTRVPLSPAQPRLRSIADAAEIALGTRPPRTVTSPYATRPSAGSATAYSAAAVPDEGTNTPAATRPRPPSDPMAPAAAQPATPRTATPTPARTTTPPPARTPTATPRQPRTTTPTPRAPRTATAPSGVAAPRTSTDPAPATDPAIAARTGTEDGVRFHETPTDRSTDRPTDRPPRAGTGPAVPRVPTSEADVVRTFAEQRTPTFGDQRTPTFGDQRTPTDGRPPTDPALARAPTGPASARVSTDNAAAAEAAFKRGELAMKRDQPGEAVLEFKAACDLNPSEFDYAGMLAWAKFCAAGDKQTVAADTRKALERAIAKSSRPERARFYLGRVERMLGRDKEALRHFQEVLDLKANHAEAASEVRAIESRLAAASKGGGLFGKKR